MSIEHSLITATDNHGIVSGLGPYTTAALRQAAVVAATDVGKVAIQVVAGVPTLWLLYSQAAGVPTWYQINTTADSGGSSFSGDFGALFTSYGLTVRAYFRMDQGVSGTTGSGITTLAKQGGDTIDMTASGAAANGVGTVTVGLNGRAGLSTNGASQGGYYNFASGGVPASVNHHIWAIERILVTPSAQAFLHADNGSVNQVVFVGTGQTSPAANVTIYNAGYGPVTTGVVVNQWYRVRASWLGGTVADQLRVGAHAPAAVASSNGFSSAQRGWAGKGDGSLRLSLETLCLLELDGPVTSFLTACADADAKAQAFWTSAIEI